MGKAKKGLDDRSIRDDAKKFAVIEKRVAKAAAKSKPKSRPGK